MVAIANTFEGGTDGTAITTGNSGGASGDAAAAINGTAPTFASAGAVHGAMGFASAAASGTASSLQWTLNNAQAVMRFYHKFATRTNPTTLGRFRVAGASASIQQDAAGTISILNAAGTGVYTTPSALTAGTTYRFEMQVLASATVGTIAFQVFVGDSTTALYSTSLTAQNTGAAPIVSVQIGKSNTLSETTTFYFDDVAAADGTLTPIGPTADSGTASLTLTASATGRGAATASATLSLSGSATASLRATATAALTLSASGQTSQPAGASATLSLTGSALATMGRPIPHVPGAPYTFAEIAAALMASRRSWSFRYRLFPGDGSTMREIRVSKCSLTNDNTADVKLTASLSIREDDAGTINFGLDRIQPVVRLLMPDGKWQEWPAGLLMMSSPTQVRAANIQPDRDITAYDQGLILKDDLVEDRYIVTQGTRYTDAINDLIASSILGSKPAQIADNASTLPADREWDAGTSKLQIINDLLDAINYATLSFDPMGNPVARPYQSPQDASAIWDYIVGQNGVVTSDGFTETMDLSAVPNVFVLYTNSPENDGDGNPIALRAVYENNSPTSPTSTINTGRRIVSYQEVSDIADIDALNAAAQKAAEEASQVYSVVEFKSGLMPFHTTADVINVDWGDGLIKYRETGWSFDCVAGAEMSHRVQRVVAV